MGICIFMPHKAVSKKNNDTHHVMYVLRVCKISLDCIHIWSSQEPVKGVELRGSEWPDLDSKASVSGRGLSLLGLRKL